MEFDAIYDSFLREENEFSKFVDRYRDSNKKIFLFGAGLCGNIYVELFARYRIPLAGVVDSFKDTIKGMPVLRMEQVAKEYDLAECIFVISAPKSQKQILGILSQYVGASQIYSFAITRYTFPHNELALAKKHLMEHKEQYSEVYNLLADDQSRYVMEKVLRGRMSARYSDFEDARTEEFYYPSDLFTFGDDEVMVELGSNDGETLQEFIECCPNFKRAYCFEADKVCIGQLNKLTKSYGDRIKIIPKIAWDQHETLEFACNNGDGSSKVTTQGIGDLLETALVDEEVTEKISYMKMDIEGSEMRALRGAKRQIQQNKPRLAVSVYHRNEDIVDIPQYLLSLRPDYRIYLRHHGWDDSDTVLYAL